MTRQDRDELLHHWPSPCGDDQRVITRRHGVGDWIGEVGPKIHGWIAFRDPYGDWDVSLTGYSDDDDDDDEE